jgi:uncharacterized repeat protein (TIGR03803 family)
MKSSFSKLVCLVFCAVMSIGSPAQTLTTLTSFAGPDGNFYGTTEYGGAFDGGAVFKVNSKGKQSTLYSFCAQPSCTDGKYPTAGLVQGVDGKFYGTTQYGGTFGTGATFSITPAGKLVTLYSFCSKANCADGEYPTAGLAEGDDGKFYGTTDQGGRIGGLCGGNGCGTVFKMTRAGQLTTLYTFCQAPSCIDGENPAAGLTQGTDGNFYGTTSLSGDSETCTIACGTVFKMTPSGALTTLYTFCTRPNCSDGGNPRAALVQGADGTFYGTTSLGGVEFCGPFGLGCGTVFKVSGMGRLTTLHRFDGADGAYEWAGLAQGTDGNFYGTTAYGGTSQVCNGGCGTVFEITPTGTLTTLYNFCPESNCADGDEPLAGLVQATNGTFYGTTFQGGTQNFTCTFGCGTVFGLNVGLGRFVVTRPTSGKVGTRVVILGNNLTGATSVSFNGTAAVFTVVSGTEIKTTVPDGATDGYVQVTAQNGTLTSNVPFRLRP